MTTSPSASRFRFRAWDSDAKMMASDITLEFLAKQRNLVVPHLNISLHRAVKNGLIIMQSTGLTDKNGKEIFEGDIVRIVHCWKEGKPEIIVNATVVFDQYSDGESYGDYNHYGWILRYRVNIFDSRRTLPDAIQDGAEGVGNIYENPDLLSAA